jgi:L-ribulokinase
MSVSANNSDDQYVIGVDFGTLSGRALVVRVADGLELGTAVREYPHGVLDEALPSGVAQWPTPEWIPSG